MTGVLIITEVASAGCAFLIYFLFALWRDGRRPAKSKKQLHQLVQLHGADRLKRK